MIGAIRIDGTGIIFPLSCLLRKIYIGCYLQSIIEGGDLELHQTFAASRHAASSCLLN